MRLREKLKRSLPDFVIEQVKSVRGSLSAPPFEETVLHGYTMSIDGCTDPRLTLVIPSISPEKAFGGVVTGVDIFLEIGKRTGAALRIILDDFGPLPHKNIVESRARDVGLDISQIEILPRTAEAPHITVRSSDVFVSYNWWTTLNLQGLVDQQSQRFAIPPKPILYLIQEYEPHFYSFSSTHMTARQAFEPQSPRWGIFNSRELYDFFRAQGHRMERDFIFEPQLAAAFRALLQQPPLQKERRILVYGRPTIPRNCYPAIEKGLLAWARQYPEFANWEVLSVGMSHRPLPLGTGRLMKSAGKLAMEEYGNLLRTSAVGLSLMSSPHPSYPPLEMAHFGLWTVSNKYANKDLTQSHDNFISIADIAPNTIADALAVACRNFEDDPKRGWRGQTRRPSFLDARPFAFLDQIAGELKAQVWQQSIGHT